MIAFRSIQFQKQLTIKSEPITPQITIKSNSVLNTSTNQSNLSSEIKSFDIRQFSNTLIGLSTLRKRIGLYRETPYRTTNFRIALATLTSELTSIFRSPFVTFLALRGIIIISCLPTDSLVHLSLSLFLFVIGQIVKCFLTRNREIAAKMYLTRVSRNTGHEQHVLLAKKEPRVRARTRSRFFCQRGDLLRHLKLLKSPLIAGPLNEFSRFSCLPYIRQPSVRFFNKPNVQTALFSRLHTFSFLCYSRFTRKKTNFYLEFIAKTIAYRIFCQNVCLQTDYDTRLLEISQSVQISVGISAVPV